MKIESKKNHPPLGRLFFGMCIGPRRASILDEGKGGRGACNLGEEGCDALCIFHEERDLGRRPTTPFLPAELRSKTCDSCSCCWEGAVGQGPYFIFGFMNSLRGGIPKLEFFLCSISDLLYKFRRSIFEQSQFLLPSLFLSPAGLSL